MSLYKSVFETYVRGVKQGLHLAPGEKGGRVRRQVAARCEWLRRKWLRPDEAERVKRRVLEDLGLCD